ncbi:MAG: GGDEF domain-containing protein [Solirubrobacterales bacterium]
MSFGRRLALFFVLIAIVPTAALIGILIFVSQESQRGKADARLAAGLETAVAVYRRDTTEAQSEARRLARDPALASALKSHDAAALVQFTGQAVHEPGVVRVEVDDNRMGQSASAGPANAIALGEVNLTVAAATVGALRVSTTTPGEYANEVHALTNRQVVVSRNNAPLAATVAPPSSTLAPDETSDLTIDGTDYRAHMLTLNGADNEAILLLGPPKQGGLLGIGGPALVILIWFLVAAVVLAWGLARALTRLHERVAAQAVTDPLTGLWNRRHMGQTLEREVDRAVRFGHPISMVILDVDDFKAINDRQGHLQGDVVLETVADAVRETIRTIDVAARYGGDELALILLETGREGATTLAERLREQVRDMGIPLRDGGTMSATLSLGVSTIPDSAGDLESLVDTADRALLRAKRAGKNQIRTAPSTRLADA